MQQFIHARASEKNHQRMEKCREYLPEGEAPRSSCSAFPPNTAFFSDV